MDCLEYFIRAALHVDDGESKNDAIENPYNAQSEARHIVVGLQLLDRNALSHHPKEGQADENRGDYDKERGEYPGRGIEGIHFIPLRTTIQMLFLPISPF